MHVRVGNRALISGLPEISINNAQVGQARLASDFAHADRMSARGCPPYALCGEWSSINTD
jgi:hypothetical protein